jgi:uncharacterized protein YvpB
MSNSYKNIFVSQIEQNLYPEVGCGVASLLMLLKHAQFEPLPTWEALCKALRLDTPPFQKGYSGTDPAIGLYPEDLYRFVIQNGLSFRMHFLNEEWKEALEKAPIMVMMMGLIRDHELDPHEAHWVVLTEFEDNIFTYLDPLGRVTDGYTKQITINDFLHSYTGLALQLIDIE